MENKKYIPKIYSQIVLILLCWIFIAPFLYIYIDIYYAPIKETNTVVVQGGLYRNVVNGLFNVRFKEWTTEETVKEVAARIGAEIKEVSWKDNYKLIVKKENIPYKEMQIMVDKLRDMEEVDIATLIDIIEINQ